MKQQSATLDNLDKRQVNGKTSDKVRIRSGVNTTAYWRSKLFRNSYRDRNGQTIQMPEWYARFRHEGITKKVKLRSADKEQAAEDALILSQKLAEEGWSAVTNRLSRLPSSPSIDEFCEIYQKTASSMERAPRPVSVNLYCRCLKLICRYASIREIRQLTGEAIESARDNYRAKARKEDRGEAAIQNTISKILRNAAACFSREARSIMARNSLKVQNPFEGIRKTQDIEPVYALPREIIQRIWGDLPKLRDGDPHTSYSGVGTKDRKKRPKFEFKSFSKIDFRKPYPASYAAILLAFGAGLRANEIDKARWSWFMFNDKGECLIVIKPEFDFKPKGGSARAIKIPTEVHQALVATRTDLTSAYVLGGEETTAETLAHGEGYRRKDVMTIANTWLRLRGVENNSRYGNPLHRLRKQFGSTVATEFGLFAAQKYLGHTSPTVTAKYYAAQTELPELTHVQLLG